MSQRKLRQKSNSELKGSSSASGEAGEGGKSTNLKRKLSKSKLFPSKKSKVKGKERKLSLKVTNKKLKKLTKEDAYDESEERRLKLKKIKSRKHKKSRKLKEDEIHVEYEKISKKKKHHKKA